MQGIDGPCGVGRVAVVRIEVVEEVEDSRLTFCGGPIHLRCEVRLACDWSVLSGRHHTYYRAVEKRNMTAKS